MNPMNMGGTGGVGMAPVSHLHPQQYQQQHLPVQHDMQQQQQQPQQQQHLHHPHHISQQQMAVGGYGAPQGAGTPTAVVSTPGGGGGGGADLDPSRFMNSLMEVEGTTTPVPGSGAPTPTPTLSPSKMMRTSGAPSAKDANSFHYNLGFDAAATFSVEYDRCPHWKSFKTGNSLWADVARTIVQYGLSLQLQKTATGKFPFPSCTMCSNSIGRIDACFHCVFLGCARGGHMAQHFQKKANPSAPGQGHFLSMDINRFTLHCAFCQDSVQDRELEILIREERMLAREAQLQTADPNPNRAHFRTRRALTLENDMIDQHSRPVLSYGLRGLYNLGSTCFMNTIVQALIHNPLVRAYFLADQHNCRECPRHAVASASQKICLCCDLDLLFSKAFSGEVTPHSPHQLLYSMWTYSQELAGYEQQDAHEFFISLLNGLHQHSGGAADSCTCAIHQTFGGLLKSDLTCMKCSYVSTTHDPFVDISLDLSEAAAAVTDFDSLLDSDPPKNKLSSCLRRFTSPEKLENRCENCNSALGSIKQFSIKVAPCVLAVHFKRFEHTATASTKIDTFVEFPARLDLTPYLSSPMADSVDHFLMENAGEPKVNHTYDLFAVVHHIGTLETGHYVIFVKSKGDWFRIDDAVITRSSTQEVLSLKAYMLYYVKSYLDYSKDAEWTN